MFFFLLTKRFNMRAMSASRAVMRSSAITGLLALCMALLAGPGARIAQAQDFPELTGRVVDQAQLLDAAAEAALVTELEAHEAQTSNQIVVATIPALAGYDIADYANRLGRAWQIGTAENDNGVLLVVAPNDRKVRIEVGYGLEGALTDALSSIIIQREILPPFRDNDYTSGIVDGVDAIIKAIAGEYTAPTGDPARGSNDTQTSVYENFIPLIFIAIVAVTEILRRTGMRRIANVAFPSGFVGLFAALASNSILIGIALAVLVFVFMYLKGSGNGPGGGGTSSGRRGRYIGTGGFGGGGFGGGGFSGGGGSFGGGGASGSW